jgi:hypothetical protein
VPRAHPRSARSMHPPKAEAQLQRSCGGAPVSPALIASSTSRVWKQIASSRARTTWARVVKPGRARARVCVEGCVCVSACVCVCVCVCLEEVCDCSPATLSADKWATSRAWVNGWGGWPGCRDLLCCAERLVCNPRRGVRPRFQRAAASDPGSCCLKAGPGPSVPAQPAQSSPGSHHHRHRRHRRRRHDHHHHMCCLAPLGALPPHPVPGRPWPRPCRGGRAVTAHRRAAAPVRPSSTPRASSSQCGASRPLNAGTK